MRAARQLTALGAIVAISVAAAACSDGNGATPSESIAGPVPAPSMSAVAARGPASIAGMFRGYKHVVDLTQTLDENTPIIQLPAPFANSPGLTRDEISFFNAPGPFWAWYTLHLGEHTGTHFDAPCHWITGRDGDCLDDIPAEHHIGPAVVIDVRDKVAENPDYLVTVEDALEWERRYGRIPQGAWVILQTGWSSRYHDAALYLNGGHTPGPSKELSEFLAFERDIRGLGVETVGTDAGMAGTFDPPFPNHNIMLGAGKYGLTSLTNVDRLPPRGAILIAAPMKLRDGTGSPVRVFALVP
ncbi:MAG TPA: cyclase family protein [Longimicrobiales bacterium]